MVSNSNRSSPDRAMQFAPFAALKGYYESIRNQERITQPKKELSDDDSKLISNTLNILKIGVNVKIRYYDIDSYITIEGTVTEVNLPYHKLKVNKTTIPFADIYSICINGRE